MYYLNKIVGFLTNPLSVGMALTVFGLLIWHWRRLAYATLASALVWFWVWSMPAVCRWTGGCLEGEWLTAAGRVPTAEELPSAEAIVLLSGGMGANTLISDQGEIFAAGDRTRFAAQLYRAGKAPRVVLSGCDVRQSTIPFLRDLGVPESAMVFEDQSWNTEENARFTSRLLAAATKDGAPTGGRKKILLVTSAFHMRRSVLMFAKYAPELETVPAPSDFEVLTTYGTDMRWDDFLPDVEALSRNSVHVKELVGYWGYRLLR